MTRSGTTNRRVFQPGAPARPETEEPASEPAPVTPEVCVCSNDDTWAYLLTENLVARGLRASRCDLGSLKERTPHLSEGSWIVLDGGWPTFVTPDRFTELNSVLDKTNVNTVVAVDSLIGHHPVSGIKTGSRVGRNPDMRHLVRSLMNVFGLD